MPYMLKAKPSTDWTSTHLIKIIQKRVACRRIYSSIYNEVKMKQTKNEKQKWAATIRDYAKTQKSHADAAYSIGIKIHRFQAWLYAKNVPDKIIRDEIEFRIEAVIAARN